MLNFLDPPEGDYGQKLGFIFIISFSFSVPLMSASASTWTSTETVLMVLLLCFVALLWLEFQTWAKKKLKNKTKQIKPIKYAKTYQENYHWNLWPVCSQLKNVLKFSSQSMKGAGYGQAWKFQDKVWENPGAFPAEIGCHEKPFENLLKFLGIHPDLLVHVVPSEQVLLFPKKEKSRTRSMWKILLQASSQ